MIAKCVEEELNRKIFIVSHVGIVWIKVKKINTNAIKMLGSLNALYVYKY